MSVRQLMYHCHMGVAPWLDRGHFPLLFEVEGTFCYCPPNFSGVDIYVLMHTVDDWSIFVKFTQLIRMKIINIVATRYPILMLKMHQIQFRLGLRLLRPC